MALGINTNLSSLNAQFNLNKSNQSMQTAMERLASGLRINSAKDDAAGLSIATRMGSQLSGTQVAVRNANDGISLAQTAEGALDSINTSLGRIRELAVQASNATNTDADRAALNAEAQQLIEEIDTVAKSANFNGINLLDGSFSEMNFQTGANVGDNISVNVNEMSIDKLGAGEGAGVASNGQYNATAGNLNTISSGDLVINGVSIAPPTSSGDTASTTDKSASAIAIADAINQQSDATGVTATANETTAQGTTMVSAALTGSITLNGVDIAVSVNNTISDEANLTAVSTAINNASGATGVTAVINDNRIDLVAEDGRNIELGFTTVTAAATGLGAAGVYSAGVTLESKDGSDIDLSTTTGNISNSGFVEGTFSGGVATASSSLAASTDGGTALAANIAAGDLVINGVSVAATKASDDSASFSDGGTTVEDNYVQNSGIAIAAAINDVSDQTGVTARVNETVMQATTGTGASLAASTVTINGASVSVGALSGSDAGADRKIAMDAINSISGQTGVVAEDTGTGLKLTAADGRNINFTQSAAGLSTAVGIGATGTNPNVQRASVTLESASEISLDSATGNIANTGFRVGTYGGAENGTFLKDVDLSTAAGAEDAIAAIDNAIQSVASERANLGAIQNRFSSTIDNLNTNIENLAASQSRIQDADFAAETAALSRAQVLSQAGISVLAQANARPQQVLSLLG